MKLISKAANYSLYNRIISQFVKNNKNSFSSEFRKDFDQKVFKKKYGAVGQILHQLIQLQKIGWRQYESDMRELKSGKYFKLVKRFDRRVKNLLFKKRHEDQFFTEQDSNILDQQTENNVSVTFEQVFNAYPKTKFSISESYLYLFDYYTRIIQNYQQYSKIGTKSQQDFTSRFSSAAFKIRSQEHLRIRNQFFKALPVLLNIQQQQDLQFFSKVLSFNSITPYLLTLQKVVTSKYMTQYKVLKAYSMYLQRFRSIQQQFSNFVFNDYDLFKEQTASLVFKKVKKYKGDFQFAIKQERVFGIPIQKQNSIVTISQVCHILQAVAKFGVLSDKFLISAQLLIKGYWDKKQLLSSRNLALLLKVITVGGRPMKIVDQNLFDLYQSLISQNSQQNVASKYCQNLYYLLCYASLSQYQNHFVVNQVFQHLQQSNKKQLPYFEINKPPKYSVDWLLYRIVQCTLQCRFDNDLKQIIKFTPEQKQEQIKQNNSCIQLQKQMVNLSIERFLKQFNYNYSVQVCPITSLPYYKFYAPEKQQESDFSEYKTVLYPLPSVFFNPNIKSQAQQSKISYQDNVKSNPLNIMSLFQATYSSNGLFKMLMNCVVQQDFIKKKQSLSVYKNKVFKTVNLAMMQSFERKGQKDEFLKKKLKGIKPVKVQKQRKFHF